VQTRSPIAARDIDLFRRFERIRVNFSVPTDSEEVRLRYEPHAPSIEARLRAAEAVAAAGIAVSLCVAPMLPIRDPGAFGRRLAATGADRFLTQYFHRAKERFASSTPDAVVARLREDGWTREAYEHARRAITAGLGEGRELRQW
jgi:DNA repair photolyase